MADTKLVAGGVPNPSSVLVSADQDTILGDGTAENPLRVADQPPPDTGTTFVASFRGGVPVPGLPVRVSLVSVAGGITTVQGAGADVASFGQFDSTAQQLSIADGVVKSVNGDGTVVVQESGVLTLTTDEWDDVTGASGGLTLGRSYYLPFSGAPLSGAPPTFPGSYVSRVGVGLNATDLLLATGSTPTSKFDFLLANFVGGSPVLGQAVYVASNPSGVPQVSAGANTAQATSQVVGLVVDLNTAGIGHTVQMTGVVELTTTQWNVIKGGSGGLTPGAAYFLAATNGGLALAAAVVGSGTRIAQVGLALSTTKLYLTTPALTTGSLAIP